MRTRLESVRVSEASRVLTNATDLAFHAGIGHVGQANDRQQMTLRKQTFKAVVLGATTLGALWGFHLFRARSVQITFVRMTTSGDIENRSLGVFSVNNGLADTVDLWGRWFQRSDRRPGYLIVPSSFTVSVPKKSSRLFVAKLPAEAGVWKLSAQCVPRTLDPDRGRLHGFLFRMIRFVPERLKYTWSELFEQPRILWSDWFRIDSPIDRSRVRENAADFRKSD